MDLTQETILQHGRSSPFRGKLEDPKISVEAENPMCGDSLKIDIRIKKGQITDIVFSGEGCLMSQAAASLLVCEAKRVKDLKKVRNFSREIVLKLLGIPLTPSRVKCALLSLSVLKQVTGG